MSKKPDYPNEAGWHQGSGSTSQDAAEGVEGAGRAELLRSRCHDWFKTNKGTADECAAALGESILAVRPRCTELRQKGLVAPTGERRRSSGGRMAAVLSGSSSPGGPNSYALAKDGE